MKRWLQGILVVAMVASGACKPSSRSEPVHYQSMRTCYAEVPVVMTLGGENRDWIVPRVRQGRLQVVSTFSAWWRDLGPSMHAPENVVIADAEENTFVERYDLDAATLVGVSTSEAVPRPAVESHERILVFRDMDSVLPDFAAGRLPATRDGRDALERLRTQYPRMVAKEHLIVYERLSPAWFAFLRGEPDFASKGHT